METERFREPTPSESSEIAIWRGIAIEIWPYMARVLFAMRFVVDTKPGTTMAVDASWRCFVNMETARGWGDAESAAVLLHESQHLFRGHGRLFENDPAITSHQVWNIACDAAINDDLAQSMKLPEGVVLPGDFQAEDGKTEEYYYWLLQQQAASMQSSGGSDSDDDGDGDSDDQPACGTCVNKTPETDNNGTDSNVPVEGITAIEIEAVQLAAAAEIQEYAAQHPGSVPAGMERWAKKLVSKRVNWRTVLHAKVRWATETRPGKSIVSWRRESRRPSLDRTIIRPSEKRPVPNIVVVVDTSGSMSEHQLGIAAAETKKVLLTAGARTVRLITFDAAVYDENIRTSDLTTVALRGGGGTAAPAAFEHLCGMKPKPDTIIMFTDGYTAWPTTWPGERTVVVVMDGPVPKDTGPNNVVWVPVSTENIHRR